MVERTGPHKKKVESYTFLLALLDAPGRRKEIAEFVENRLREVLGETFTLTVVDIAKAPDVMARVGLLAVPALIRQNPSPRKMIVGDLRDIGGWSELLGLPHVNT